MKHSCCRFCATAEPDDQARADLQAQGQDALEDRLSGANVLHEGTAVQDGLKTQPAANAVDLETSSDIEVDWLPAKDTPLSESKQENVPLWQKGWHLTLRTARLAWPCAWQLLLIFAICDSLNFLLVRTCHRITNQVALQFLLPPQLANPQNIGRSLWYLTSNPEISNFRTGVMLVVMLPLNVLLKTLAASTAQLIATNQEGKKEHPSWRPPVRKIFGEIRKHFSTARKAVARLWKVDLLVAAQALPLQGLCLLVLPLPWSFPRLLKLQLAAPLALFEGEVGSSAIKKSREAVETTKQGFAFPFLGLLTAARLVAVLGEAFFVRILSPRIAREIPEIPLTAFLVVSITTLILNRLSDLLPLAAYLQVKEMKSSQAGADSVSQGIEGTSPA